MIRFDLLEGLKDESIRLLLTEELVKCEDTLLEAELSENEDSRVLFNVCRPRICIF